MRKTEEPQHVDFGVYICTTQNVKNTIEETKEKTKKEERRKKKRPKKPQNKTKQTKKKKQKKKKKQQHSGVRPLLSVPFQVQRKVHNKVVLLSLDDIQRSLKNVAGGDEVTRAELEASDGGTVREWAIGWREESHLRKKFAIRWHKVLHKGQASTGPDGEVVSSDVSGVSGGLDQVVVEDGSCECCLAAAPQRWP